MGRKRADGSVTTTVTADIFSYLVTKASAKQTTVAGLLREILQDWYNAEWEKIRIAIAEIEERDKPKMTEKQRSYIESLSKRANKALPKDFKSYTLQEADKLINELLELLNESGKA